MVYHAARTDFGPGCSTEEENNEYRQFADAGNGTARSEKVYKRRYRGVVFIAEGRRSQQVSAVVSRKKPAGGGGFLQRAFCPRLRIAAGLSVCGLSEVG